MRDDYFSMISLSALYKFPMTTWNERRKIEIKMLIDWHGHWSCEQDLGRKRWEVEKRVKGGSGKWEVAMEDEKSSSIMLTQ